MALCNHVKGAGCSKPPQVNMAISTSVRNRYISGANVGYRTTANREALRRRAEMYQHPSADHIIFHINNHIFRQTTKDESHFKFEPVTAFNTTMINRRSESAVAPIHAYRDSKNRITLTRPNAPVDVLYRSRKVKVGWIMVVDETGLIVTSPEKFNPSTNRGYFSFAKTSEPTRIMEWYHIGIDPVFIDPDYTAEISFEGKFNRRKEYDFSKIP